MSKRRLLAAALIAALFIVLLGGLGQFAPVLPPASSRLFASAATPATLAPQGATQLGLVLSSAMAVGAARSIGARAVKVLADWSAIEPRRGEQSWADLDRRVAAVITEGLVPVIVLAYTPRWASIGTGPDLSRPEIFSRQPPRDVRDWERFVESAATRFRGRVFEWQVWTQLGLPQFRGTGSEYLALVQAARSRLRAVDPSSRLALASPAGVDLVFLTHLLQDAPAAFDAVVLSPQGFAPESLLRPLGILGRRMHSSGKAIWVEWAPAAEAPNGIGGAADATGQWARILSIAQAAGVDRLFVADPARVAGDLREIGALLAARPFLGYLVRDPDVYAAAYGGGADAVLVAWATAGGRTLEFPASPLLRVTTVDGHSAPAEVRGGRASIALSMAPQVISGIPQVLVDEARATALAHGPMLPVPGSERDFSRSAEVSAHLGRVGEEHGLYNLPFRSRPNGAVEAVEVGGVEAVQTSVARQAIYVYFDIDDTFLYFAEGRVPVEITVEVWGARAPRQVGFNLLYDSTSGYRFTPWQWVDTNPGWVTYTIRLTDANMANTWGWDFAVNTSGNRSEDLVIRTVTVRKGGS